MAKEKINWEDENILEALDYLNAKEEEKSKIIKPTMYIEQNSEDTYNIDFSDIVDQELHEQH